jgi:hypothetical protein
MSLLEPHPRARSYRWFEACTRMRTRTRALLVHHKFLAGKSYWTGRISTVDLLVLSSLNFLFILNAYYLRFSQNELPYLNEEVNCTEPSTSVGVPCSNIRREISLKKNGSNVIKNLTKFRVSLKKHVSKFSSKQCGLFGRLGHSINVKNCTQYSET